jgi:hypothetical protein
LGTDAGRAGGAGDGSGAMRLLCVKHVEAPEARRAYGVMGCAPLRTKLKKNLVGRADLEE